MKIEAARATPAVAATDGLTADHIVPSALDPGSPQPWPKPSQPAPARRRLTDPFHGPVRAWAGAFLRDRPGP
jgi:hypothetical protein